VRKSITVDPHGRGDNQSGGGVRLPGTVHPHGRGDNTARARETSKGDGSPPRAWGQQVRRPLRKRQTRFTPTGVGTTTASGGASGWCPVHPHGRGDNARQRPAPAGRCGSPPRAWGQQLHLQLSPLKLRFTPTGVGTTELQFADPLLRSVHPHGRGDNSRISSSMAACPGSPPRAWGQRPPAPGRWWARRFTPTGVGTTSAMVATMGMIAVHPHGRGDNRDLVAKVHCLNGSPPRAWGQRPRRTPRGRSRRFTPTGVGTTPRAGCPPPPRPVHPHGRGDNGLRVPLVSDLLGSPPRAWGQRGAQLGLNIHVRFTPTGVGTTPRTIPPSASPTVHPHGRGDNTVVVIR